MKNTLKRILPDTWLNFYRKRISEKKKTQNIFTNIYNTNHWNSEESVSGPGSDLSQTKMLIPGIENLISDFQIKSILDIPCGDFNWMQNVNLTSVNYIGADIVTNLIENNKEKFGRLSNVRFRVMDLTNDELPQVDLIICRDCLVHLSYDGILKALKNIRASKAKYLLTTSFVKRTVNIDIPVGKWRPLNLQAAPFYLPDPVRIINENCTENNGIYYDKSMLLWEIDKLNLSISI